MNCGFNFKKQNSKVLSEAEKTFTIFAAVGVKESEVISDINPGNGEDFHQESSRRVADATGLYDSSADMADQSEPNLENSDDFELDLSDTDGSDSEGWDIGATLTEDLSEITSVAPVESLNNAKLETGEFEVKGLGFDFTSGFEQAEANVANEENSISPELEYNVFADETAAPEMEPYAGQNEIEFELPEDESSHQAEFEGILHEPLNQREIEPVENLELNDFSAQGAEQISDIELGEISLETELELGNKKSDAVQSSEVPIDSTESKIELDPILELEKLQMDLETDLMGIEPIKASLSNDSEEPQEGSKLKMDSGGDKTNPSLPDQEPTSDS